MTSDLQDLKEYPNKERMFYDSRLCLPLYKLDNSAILKPNPIKNIMKLSVQISSCKRLIFNFFLQLERKQL